MKKLIMFLVLVGLALADPNDVVVYTKLDANTVEKTVTTTYKKSELENQRAILVNERDSRKARIDARYQPLIDDIDIKLNLFN